MTPLLPTSRAPEDLRASLWFTAVLFVRRTLRAMYFVFDHGWRGANSQKVEKP